MDAYISLAVFFALTAAAAVTGARFMPGEWYANLNKPSWTPPDWLFPIAWTVLYVMIAVAAWYVWSAEGLQLALIAWGAQLALNAAWSYVMFGRKQIGVALVTVVGLLASIIAFIVLAWPASETAAWLFVPYLFWVSFAAILNAEVWRLNPNGSVRA